MNWTSEGMDEGSKSKSRNFHSHNNSSEFDNEIVKETIFQSSRVKKKLWKLANGKVGVNAHTRAQEREREREQKKVRADTREWKRCTAAKGALSRSLSALNNLVLGNLIDTGQTGRPDFKYAGTRFLAHGSRLLLSFPLFLSRLFVLVLRAFTRTDASSRVWLLPFSRSVRSKRTVIVFKTAPMVICHKNFYAKSLCIRPNFSSILISIHSNLYEEERRKKKYENSRRDGKRNTDR